MPPEGVCLCRRPGVGVVLLQPGLQLVVHLVLGNGSRLYHLVQLFHGRLRFVRVSAHIRVVQPVILAGGAAGQAVKGKFPAVEHVHRVLHIALEGFQDLPPVAKGHAGNFQPVLHQGQGVLLHLAVVGGQLCLVHVCRVLTQLAHKLCHVPSQIVHGADVRGAHHIIILAVQGVVHQAVHLAAKQKISGRALGKQPGKTAQQALQGHVPVFVLLPVPPVQQKVRADLHQVVNMVKVFTNSSGLRWMPARCITV